MERLVKHRKRLGMSQAHVAWLLGTRQSNVSAYEAGTLEPGGIVQGRIQAFMNVQPGTVHGGTWLGTLVSHAVSLRSHTDAHGALNPEADIDVLRHIVGMNDAFLQVSSIHDQLLFLTQPSSTGNAQLDALLAGMAVHWSRGAGLDRAPLWTREAQYFLDELWWIGIPESLTRLRGQALAHGIPSLRSRGIFMDRSNLASV